MAIDASIYGLLDTKGLQQGLAGIGEAYASGQERKNRLAQLAQQQELGGLQIEKAKQEAALYPQQLEAQKQAKEAQYMQGVSREIAQSPENMAGIIEKHSKIAPQLGINPEHLTWLASDLSKSTDIKDLTRRAMYHANPQEYEKEALKAEFTKSGQTSGTTLSKLISERAAIAQANPNAPELRVYDQMIQKETTSAPQTQIVVGENGEMKAVTIPKVGKATVQDIGVKKPNAGVKLSPQAQKELFEADETVQSSKNVLGLLGQALQLNDKAYSGFGAKQRAVMRSNLPGESPEANATIDLDNLMTGQALESLKSTFGGMPTEGERKILLDIQASAEKTPAQRKSIIERAQAAVDKRIRFNSDKAKKLRSGEYFESAPTSDIGVPSQGGVKFLGFE